jgi:tRNA threonylcarbamoyladenosine biosynthesis protein TsaE
MNIHLPDSDATEAFGRALWPVLPERCLIFLHGDLGAGKTTLMRGLIRAAGYQGAVKSPTYGLVEEYLIGERRIFHFDLYRLADAEELLWIGIEDYLAQQAVCCIEWPVRGQGVLPEPDLEIKLQVVDGARVLEIKELCNQSKKTIDLLLKNNKILLQFN